MRAGALSYLLKDVEPSELVRAVRGAARGSDANMEIACGLHISEETVKTHVSNLLAKLHVETRTQAALYALWRSLILPDDTTANPA